VDVFEKSSISPFFCYAMRRSGRSHQRLVSQSRQGKNMETGAANQHIATHRNILQHTATHRYIRQHTATHCNTLQHIATHCNTLQHTATHCNSPQHTAAQHNTRCESIVHLACAVSHPDALSHACTNACGGHARVAECVLPPPPCCKQ